MADHELTGVLHPDSAAEAEREAHEAARAYFGVRAYTLTIDTSEIRSVGGDVYGYRTVYTAREASTDG